MPVSSTSFPALGTRLPVSYHILAKINTERKFTTLTTKDSPRANAHVYVLQVIKFVDHTGSVHATPEEFGNAVLFQRLGLPSTLIRHENERSFWKTHF